MGGTRQPVNVKPSSGHTLYHHHAYLLPFRVTPPDYSPPPYNAAAETFPLSCSGTPYSGDRPLLTLFGSLAVVCSSLAAPRAAGLRRGIIAVFISGPPLIVAAVKL